MNYVIEQLAQKGRYGDDKLVHMSSGEVAGLRALANAAGTDLTKNPETGLDEAFNLKTLLPLVAGAALGPAGIGLTAMQAGLVTGAAATAITGDPMQGLSAGLGGFGGAGLAGSLSAAGSAGAQTGSTAAASTGAETVGAATPTNLSNAFPGGVPSMNPATDSFIGSQTTTNLGNALSPSEIASQAANYTPNVGQIGASTSPVGGLESIGQGAKGVISDAPGARDAFMKDIGGKKGLLKSGLAATAPLMNESMQPEPMTAYSDTGDRDYETYLDRMGLRRTRARFAEGGLADASLSNKNGLGSLIKGDSDGMGDEVLAKVSPGEYIITAQAVSALGNGNTDAGAKKLDGMMDRIYEKQTGKPKQMKEMNANEVLVA